MIVKEKEVRKPNPGNLPFLLKLLDDDSKTVRAEVRKELLAFNDGLAKELDVLEHPPSEEDRELIFSILEEAYREDLQKKWITWKTFDGDLDKLERALTFLAEYLSCSRLEGQVKQQLDELAEEYSKSYSSQNPQTLAAFLFQAKGFKGTRENYYHPQHSNLAYVLREKKGIPITLTCIYMLVGARLEMPIEGCNFPGHFLARTFIRGEMVLIDCFNGGNIIPANSYRKHKDWDQLRRAIFQPTNAEVLVVRVLNNLIFAYRKKKDEDKVLFLKDLRKVLHPDTESTPDTL